MTRCWMLQRTAAGHQRWPLAVRCSVSRPTQPNAHPHPAGMGNKDSKLQRPGNMHMNVEPYYIIHALERTEEILEDEGMPKKGIKKRLDNPVAHKAYQVATSGPASKGKTGGPCCIEQVCGGPLLSDDASTMAGSAWIVKAARQDAEELPKADPVNKAGAYKTVTAARYMAAPPGIKQIIN